MSPRVFVTTVLLAFAFLSGCAGTSAFQSASAYYRSEPHPEIGRSAMLQATRRFLSRNGWTNVRQPGRGYRLSAVQPPDRGMRDSIVVEVKESGELLVWVRTQLSDEDGRWRSPPFLCDSYSFSRERDIVERIVGSVADEGARNDLVLR
ncbi:MAG: hypothetical protein R3A48_09900 [Polyangiales bacterium]